MPIYFGLAILSKTQFEHHHQVEPNFITGAAVKEKL